MGRIISSFKVSRPAAPKLGGLHAVALGGAYVFLLLFVSVWCRDPYDNYYFWPSNAALIAGLLVLRPRLSWILLCGAFFFNVSVNLQIDKLSLSESLLYSCLNTLLSVSVAALSVRFCGAAIDLTRFRRLAQFGAICLGAAMAEAAIGELCLVFRDPIELNVLQDWLQWTSGDALGVLIATPTLLLRLQPRKALSAYRSRTDERLALLLIAVLLTVASFCRAHSFLLLAIYPLMILIAFRAGPFWVSLSVLAVALAASVLTIRGYGPIALIADGNAFYTQCMMQLFLVSIGICSLPTTNALVERYRISERLERAHAAARAARADAESANDAKSQFLANMSHEIRTPLNGVLGMAQVMEMDDLAPKQRDRLKIIRGSGEMLLTIINDILDFSKIEAGKLTLELRPFEIEEIVGEMRAAFATPAAEKRLGFSVGIDPDAAGSYRGDSVRVRQIIYNLLSNALKFTEHGRVDVIVKRIQSGIEIRVSDTGIGIPAHRVAHLFQKFEQAEMSTTRRFGGTGLGLAICRELVGMMGGSISVESSFGQGSVFTVLLPLEQVSREVGQQAGVRCTGNNAAERLCGMRPKVLAAEDNRVNQSLLKALLETVQIVPRLVSDGRAALEAWRAEDWDVILMDVEMPVLDGVSATAEIRAEEAMHGRRRTPIVALTANVLAHQKDAYRGAGMDAFVDKPIQRIMLMEALCEACSKTESGAERARAGDQVRSFVSAA